MIYEYGLPDVTSILFVTSTVFVLFGLASVLIGYGIIGSYNIVHFVLRVESRDSD